MKEIFNEEYFERGVATGVSLYENYRWLPELTLSMAMSYIDCLGLTREDSILDFGCAKGYVVKALRLLYRQAWGCDISEYAISCAENDIKEYIALCNEQIVPFDVCFNWIIIKDVLEHIEESEIQGVLRGLRTNGRRMFAIIPLGEDDKFIIPAYQQDKTHKLAKPFDWWFDQFQNSGWTTDTFTYRIPGIKDNWATWEMGNGFFINK